MPEKKTRKTTAAERLAACALGQPEPDVIELSTRSAAEQHQDRLRTRAGWQPTEDDGPPPAV
ncbi:hypothetical protein OG453_33675 [Streptomyces sp. NBC_01381]|uniref:hypothetical protein n=1 Tax=Streptomyces sp. NBC_01381 TaxID=2903845 RepID=UPI00224FCD36|nr:hypothetical protein [Streptomyces sp. NBC_01381]MCX4671583.1 hypothetical protein [Streptomyces sp. NBC_01381]